MPPLHTPTNTCSKGAGLSNRSCMVSLSKLANCCLPTPAFRRNFLHFLTVSHFRKQSLRIFWIISSANLEQMFVMDSLKTCGDLFGVGCPDAREMYPLSVYKINQLVNQLKLSINTWILCWLMTDQYIRSISQSINQNWNYLHLWLEQESTHILNFIH